MRQVSEILEGKVPEQTVSAEYERYFMELRKRIDSCQQEDEMDGIVDALDILLNYSSLIPIVTLIVDKEKKRLLLETEEGNRYQISVTRTTEKI